MHIGAVHVHVETKLLTDSLNVLEAFLVVGACTTHPDLDVVLNKERRDLSEGTYNTLERRGNLGGI